MAVVAVKSTQITNRDATPRVINNPRVTSGVKQVALDTAVITSGNSVGSTYLIAQVPSRAIVTAVCVSSPDIGTTTAADIGLYQATLNGGAVVDADFFASAVSLSGGAISKSDVTFESGAYTLANGAKPLWEALGLSADPGIDYDVVLTLTGAADATGTALVEIEYVM
jgi:hypothetical protein